MAKHSESRPRPPARPPFRCSPLTFTLCSLPPKYEFTSELRSRHDRPTLILDHLSSIPMPCYRVCSVKATDVAQLLRDARQSSAAAAAHSLLFHLFRGTILEPPLFLNLPRPISGIASTGDTPAPFKKSARVQAVQDSSSPWRWQWQWQWHASVTACGPDIL